MYDTEEINDWGSLATRRREWQTLLETTPEASFFHTLDWLEVYWRHYGQRRKLRAILVYKGSALVGVLPLVVQSESRKVGQVHVLTYPLDDWGSFYSPLGNTPQETLVAGLAHVRATPRDWDLIDLRWQRRGGAIAAATERALALSGLPANERVRQQTALIHLPPDWNAYLQTLPKKFRETHRRYQRKLNAQGELLFVSHRPRGAAEGDADPRWDLYEHCEQIAQRSWQGSSSNGTTLSHESVRPFLRDAHAAAAHAGALDMHLLYLSGQPLAFAYNYHFRGAVFGLRIGYNAELSRNGVGNEMTLHAVRHAIERGDRLYDLGPGSLDYKRTFATEIAEISQYTHYCPYAARAAALRLNQFLRQLWERRFALAPE